MVGRLLDVAPTVAWVGVDEDDRRSTSTVASTAGTGFISLAHRMAALALDFSDKLGGDEAGSIQEEEEASVGVSERGREVTHRLQQSVLEDDEEDEDHDGTRSERTVNTAVTGEGEGEGYGPGEHEETRVSRRRSSLMGGAESPDHHMVHRLPFQICSRLFVAKGNLQLKRMSICQVEELRQHGYAIIDNFIPRELAQQVKAAALLHYSRGRMIELPRPGFDSRAAQASGTGSPCPSAAGPGPGSSGELVLPLVIGKPPADSTPLALVLVALQELYEDLHQFTRLHRVLGEYQLGLQLPGSSGVPRHRDALPDGGRKRGQRRLTCMVCCGTESRREEGGAVTVWPPRRVVPSGSAALVSERSGGPGSNPTLRRSFTGSDAGTSFTESDTCSLRSHYTGPAWSYVAPSVTSSMWAEAASALDPRAEDNASLDNVSMSESIDGYAAAVAGYAGGGGHLGAGMSHASYLAFGAAIQAATLPGSAAALASVEARLAGAASSGPGSVAGGEGPAPGPGAGRLAQPRGLEWVEQDGEMVLEVAPLPGRLLVFLSGAVDHAHQPAAPTSEQVTVTAWYQ